jgi:hypothetical protein
MFAETTGEFNPHRIMRRAPFRKFALTILRKKTGVKHFLFMFSGKGPAFFCIRNSDIIDENSLPWAGTGET